MNETATELARRVLKVWEEGDAPVRASDMRLLASALLSLAAQSEELRAENEFLKRDYKEVLRAGLGGAKHDTDVNHDEALLILRAHLEAFDEREELRAELEKLRRDREAVDKSPIGTALGRGSPEVGGATGPGAPVFGYTLQQTVWHFPNPAHPGEREDCIECRRAEETVDIIARENQVLWWLYLEAKHERRDILFAGADNVLEMADRLKAQESRYSALVAAVRDLAGCIDFEVRDWAHLPSETIDAAVARFGALLDSEASDQGGNK